MTSERTFCHVVTEHFADDPEANGTRVLTTAEVIERFLWIAPIINVQPGTFSMWVCIDLHLIKIVPSDELTVG